MQELEKILEEIDVKIAESMGKKREGLLEADRIIRKHMDDDWILAWKPPESEKEVLILTDRGTITTAIYEDGTVPEERSIWAWTDIEKIAGKRWRSRGRRNRKN